MISTKEKDSSHYEVIINKDLISNSYTLFPLTTSDGETLAYVVWVGGDVMQPAIRSRDGVTFSLSFDGTAYNIGTILSLHYPDYGEIKNCSPDIDYFFSNSDIENPTSQLSINKNNASFRIDNASIFKQDYSKGVMLNMRCSFEGSLEGEQNGQAIILATYDPIN